MMFSILLIYFSCLTLGNGVLGLLKGATYEIDEIKLIPGSDNERVLQFSTFGKSQTIKLKPLHSIFSPNFKISFADEESTSEENLFDGSFYTDSNGKGSFYIEEFNGNIKIDAIIDDTYRITNSNGKHKLTRVSSNPADSFCTTIDKSEYQRDVYCSTAVNLVFNISDHLENITSSIDVDKRFAGQSDSSATVELLIVFDQITYKRITQKVGDTPPIKITKYLGIFWNFVQNKFRVMSQPKIQFSLTGIHVLPSYDWIHRSTFLGQGNNFPHAELILWDFSRTLENERNKVPEFDVAVMHTGLDLSIFNTRTGEIKKTIVGVSFTGGVCKLDPQRRTTTSCAIVEDKFAPIYSGVLTATHEMGHILGAAHDDDVGCPSKGIMATVTTDINPYRQQFTKCSLDAMRKTLNSPGTECLNDPAQPQIPLLNSPPNLSREEMCQRVYGETGVPIDLGTYRNLNVNPCNTLICFYKKNGKNTMAKNKWIPEGTPCGNNEVCLEEKCVARNE